MTAASMDVFSLRDAVIGEYKKFATSFTTIHADDIRQKVEAIDAQERYWPEPLIQVNPSYKAAAVTDIPALHRLVRRAFQLSKTLPDELLHSFEKQTAALPRATEAERLVVQRVGQDLFRKGLLEYWEGRCAITGLSVVELLRASHIKPWAACDTDAERLDVFNGLLLAPHLDAAFDKGFITVGDDGIVAVSSQLDARARQALGVDAVARVRAVATGHRGYLAWHRANLFRDARTP